MATHPGRENTTTLTLLAPIPNFSFTALPTIKKDDEISTASPCHSRGVLVEPATPSACGGVLLTSPASSSSSVSPASSPRSGSPALLEEEEEPSPCFDPRTSTKTLKWWARRYELFSRYSGESTNRSVDPRPGTRGATLEVLSHTIVARAARWSSAR